MVPENHRRPLLTCIHDAKQFLLNGRPRRLSLTERLGEKCHWLLHAFNDLKQHCTDTDLGGICAHPNLLAVVQELQHRRGHNGLFQRVKGVLLHRAPVELEWMVFPSQRSERCCNKAKVLNMPPKEVRNA